MTEKWDGGAAYGGVHKGVPYSSHVAGIRKVCWGDAGGRPYRKRSRSAKKKSTALRLSNDEPGKKFGWVTATGQHAYGVVHKAKRVGYSTHVSGIRKGYSGDLGARLYRKQLRLTRGMTPRQPWGAKARFGL